MDFSVDLDIATQSEPVYELNLFKLSETGNADSFFTHLEAYEATLNAFDGRLLSSPLLIEDGLLENSALPDTVSNLDFNYIAIAEHPTSESLQSFLNSDAIALLEASLAGVLSDRTQVIARSGRDDFASFIPLVEQASVPFGSVPFRSQPPAFLLFNAVNVQPSDTPTLIGYVNESLALSLEAGTGITDPFIPLQVTKGEFNFSTFSLTEWASDAAFDSVHENENFVTNIVPVRNSVLGEFIEAKAVLAESPSTQAVPEPSSLFYLISFVGLLVFMKRAIAS